MDTRGQRRVKSLLLMYLLVVKAAGDCPKPEGGNNIVLTDESLLMNDFPENVEITLECSNGYIKESGSEGITCIDNKWTKSDLVCKKKDCGQPPPQAHMKFNTSSGTLLGAILKVTCDKGYQITGTSYKRCFASGWSGRAKCEKVRTTVPAPTSQSQGAWTATVTPSSAAPMVHGAKTNTASTTTILPTLPQGFRGSLTAEAKAATPTVTSAASSSFQDMDDGVVNTGNHIVPVAVSVTAVSVVTILVSVWLKVSLRKKGRSGIAPI